MNKIAKLLDIRDHETIPCLMFSFLSFLIMAGIFLGRATRDSLFFIEVGAEWLPLAFVFNAVILIAISLFFSKISGKYVKEKYKLLHTNLLIFVIAIIAFGLFLTIQINFPHFNIIYWVFFIFCEIALFVMIRTFWFFAEDYFTDQQMKRLSPKFVGGGLIGIGLGGILTFTLVGIIGTENIIFIWAALVIAAIYVARRILVNIRTLPVGEKEGGEVIETEEGGILDGLKVVRRSKYLKLFVMISICAFVIASIFDLVLASTAEIHFKGDIDELTYFLGLITIIFGFGAAAVQFLFMSKIIRKYGVGGVNLIAPILLTLGSIVLIFFYRFEGAAISRILFLGNEFLFNQTIIVLIYSAVREDQRGKASFFIEGGVVNGTIGVTGAALLIYAMLFPLDKLGYVALVFGIGMLVFSFLLRKEYKKILIENLGARPPEDRNLMLKNALGLTDNASFELIRESLQSSDETTVMVAMNLIVEQKKNESNEEIKKRYLDISLKRTDDENKNIRLTAIKMIIELVRDEDFKDAYFESITNKLVKRDNYGKIRLKCGDRETINAILDIYTAWDIGITDDFEALLKYLKGHKDKEIIGDIIIHLKDIGFTGIFRGMQMLNELMDSANSVDLKVANRIFGELGEESFHKDLTKFCSDKLTEITLVKERREELEQLQEIVEAFGKIEYKNDKRALECYEMLIRCLEEPVLRKNAAKSLENLLKKKPFLFAHLKQLLYKEGGQKIELKREIPRIVRSIRKRRTR